MIRFSTSSSIECLRLSCAWSRVSHAVVTRTATHLRPPKKSHSAPPLIECGGAPVIMPNTHVREGIESRCSDGVQLRPPAPQGQFFLRIFRERPPETGKTVPAFNVGGTDLWTKEGPGRPANPRLYKHNNNNNNNNNATIAA